jgi:hypothetical protein
MCSPAWVGSFMADQRRELGLPELSDDDHAKDEWAHHRRPAVTLAPRRGYAGLWERWAAAHA